MTCSFSPICTADAEPLLAIFNHFVEQSWAAYPSAPVGMEFIERLLAAGEAYPVVTVRNDAGEVIGFGHMKAFHPADSFRRTAEIGYFLRPDTTGQGVGTALLRHLVDQARARGIRTLLASISSRNEQSLAFHRKQGFEEVGRFRAVGEKRGHTFDVVYVQKDLEADRSVIVRGVRR